MTLLSFLLAVFGILSLTAAMATTEKPKGCKRLTAALAQGNDKYLFFGNTFIKLDKDFKQVEEGDSFKKFQAPYPEAAFIFAMDHTTYIFSDKYYFSKWTNYAPVDAVVFGGQHHGYFFQNGLDAAGSLNGATVLIKGCLFLISHQYGTSQPYYLPEGIPCKPDAALSVGPDLWLFKDDNLFQISVEDKKQVKTDSVIHLDNIRFCAEGEKEA